MIFRSNRALVTVGVLALVACQQQTADNKQAELQAEIDKPAAILIVHWADGGDGYSREYSTMSGCEDAQKALLHDYAQRGYLNAKAQIESKTDAPAEPRPIAVCIPA